MTGLAITYILGILVQGVMSDATLSIYADGREAIAGVKAVVDGDLTFVRIDHVLEKLNIVSKDLGEGTMGLCKEEVCIFVQLDNEADVRHDSGRLMLNVDLIALALESNIEWIVSNKTLRFVPVDQVALDKVLKVGDFVPNFALPSISDGKMVSFSGFRGKRVLLFLWASW